MSNIGTPIGLILSGQPTAVNQVPVWTGSAWEAATIPFPDLSGYAQLSGAAFTGGIAAPSLNLNGDLRTSWPSTPPGGSTGQLQVNNGTGFAGFGSTSGNDLTLPGSLIAPQWYGSAHDAIYNSAGSWIFYTGDTERMQINDTGVTAPLVTVGKMSLQGADGGYLNPIAGNISGADAYGTFGMGFSDAYATAPACAWVPVISAWCLTGDAGNNNASMLEIKHDPFGGPATSLQARAIYSVSDIYHTLKLQPRGGATTVGGDLAAASFTLDGVTITEWPSGGGGSPGGSSGQLQKNDGAGGFTGFGATSGEDLSLSGTINLLTSHNGAGITNPAILFHDPSYPTSYGNRISSEVSGSGDARLRFEMAGGPTETTHTTALEITENGIISSPTLSLAAAGYVYGLMSRAIVGLTGDLGFNIYTSSLGRLSGIGGPAIDWVWDQTIVYPNLLVKGVVGASRTGWGLPDANLLVEIQSGQTQDALMVFPVGTTTPLARITAAGDLYAATVSIEHLNTNAIDVTSGNFVVDAYGAVLAMSTMTMKPATTAPTLGNSLHEVWMNETTHEINFDWRESDGTLRRKTLVSDV